MSALAVICLFGVVGVSYAAPASTSPTLPPHVATSESTDVCAMCHRTHVSPSSATWSTDGTQSAALLASPAEDDVDLCYTCHGVDALGSGSDVQSSFESTSAHELSASSAPYGPKTKTCSTCHDAHGSARVEAGVPYPALLQVKSGTDLEHRGDGVCTACHVVRVASRFPGAVIWRSTAHALIATAPAGTGIVCTTCHDPHGSSVAPSLRTLIATPAASAPTTVTGNDRTQCLACHGPAFGIWPGAAGYVGSSHASSTATTVVDGEWADKPAGGRLIGECQSCHAAMGADDGFGNLVPNLASVPGRQLCDSCHRQNGAAKTDLADLAYSPTTPGFEVLVSYAATASPAYDRAQIFARDSAAPAEPRALHELRDLSLSAAMAAGDLDDDGVDELVLGESGGAAAVLIQRDAARILSRTELVLPGGKIATHAAVADVFISATPVPELVYTAADGTVSVARLMGSVLQPVASIALTGTPSAIACGDLVGGSGSEIVVVSAESDMLYLLADDGMGGLKVEAEWSTRADPVAVAVADLDDVPATKEIAVANAGEATEVVSAFRSDGSEYEHGGGPLPAGEVTALAVGNILPGVVEPGTSGNEICVAYAAAGGSAGVRIMTKPTASLVSMVDTSTGTATNPTSLAFGDPDGDGDGDLAIGLAGAFTRSSTAVPARVTVLGPDSLGTGLGTSFALLAGGAESAGGSASVAIADLGAIGPARHPVGAVAGAHETTEEVPTPRHVECADCHNPHLAVSADTTTMPGELTGVLGVRPDNVNATTVSLGSQRVTATAEYEVCFSCHSAWGSPGVRDIASLVNTLGASFHPVEGPAKPSNAVGDTLIGLQVGDRIRCGSCHGASGASPVGPHRSSNAALLVRPFLAVSADSASGLCVKCHDGRIYVSGTLDENSGPRSGFRSSVAGGLKLHARHVSSFGMACASCHDSHGVRLRKHLLRDDPGVFDWQETAAGGECLTACHVSPSVWSSYAR